MPTLEQLSPRLVNEFKTVRLRALQDTPTAFGSTYAEEAKRSQEDWRRLATTRNGEGTVCYLGMDQGAPCGIIGGYVDEEDPQRVHVVSMWVAPTHRRAGLGTRLIDAVRLWADDRGADELRLMVTSSNRAAIRFYEQRGFVFTGATQPYPNDPALFEYEMVAYLRNR